MAEAPYRWYQARSDASRAAWERRWESGTAPLGPKGREYLETIAEKEYGGRPGGGGPGGGKTGGGGRPRDFDYEDYEAPVYDDEWEIDY